MNRPDLTPLEALCLESQAPLRRFLRARLGNVEDADDLLQEVFLKAAAVDATAAIDSPMAYLYRLAANAVLDRARARRRAIARDTQWRSIQQTDMAGEAVAGEADAEATVIARQRLAALNEALGSLAPQTQRAFRLHKFSGLSHAETAARMSVSRSAVEKHISLALKHLATKTAAYR